MRKLVTFLVALSVVCLSNVTAAQAGAGISEQRQQAVIELVRAHVTIDSDGLFVIDPKVIGRDREMLRGIFSRLNDSLASVDKHLRPTVGQKASKGPGLAARVASYCGYIPKWAFQAFAWYVIISGGAFSIVGAFVSATIFGLPAGAVLGAIGVSLMTTGSAFLWWVDNFMPSYGRYVCVF
ncbi:MAG: hypothetical protein ABI466_00265 [Chloroflexota bacterium]